jgi:hypothetical protein
MAWENRKEAYVGPIEPGAAYDHQAGKFVAMLNKPLVTIGVWSYEERVQSLSFNP